jgi:hypothetical protein
MLAMVGLVTNLVLVYRRFYRLNTDSSNTDSRNTEVALLNQHKPKTLRFSAVILANIIACFSIILFALPLESKIQQPEFDILITPGSSYQSKDNSFNISTLDDEVLQPQAARYLWLLVDDHMSYSEQFVENLQSRYKDKVVVIKSVQELSRLWQANKAVEKSHLSSYSLAPNMLKIIGDGLNEQQWQQLAPSKISGFNLSFYPSIKRLGLVSLHWPRELYLGQSMTVTGKLQKPLLDNSRYQLSLFNNKQLLADTEVADDGRFQFSSNVKVSGLYSYQLVLNQLPNNSLKHSSNITSLENLDESKVTPPETRLIDAKVIEDIAFNVLNSSKPRVVIKQSSPSFETRQLKQWLKQSKSTVQVITQISQNKWSKQNINLKENDKLSMQKPSEPLAKNKRHLLTLDLLSSTDLLIIDSRALETLAATEVNALELAVRQGLGLFVYAGKALLPENKLIETQQLNLLAKFNIKSQTLLKNQVIPIWSGQLDVDDENPLIATAATIDVNNNHGQALVESASGRLLVVSQQIGLGSVAISTLTKTYPWALQSGEVVYSHYWQYIFSKLARAKPSAHWLSPLPNKLNIVKQLIDVCLISSDKSASSSAMNLLEQPLLNYRKCGLYSADNPGWVTLEALNSREKLLTKQSRYIYPEASFDAWQQTSKYYLSMKNSALSIFSVQKADKDEQFQETNKLYLWLILLLSMTFLWLERKWLTD